MENAPSISGDSLLVDDAIVEPICEVNFVEIEKDYKNHRLLVDAAPKKLMRSFEKSWTQTPGMTHPAKKYPKSFSTEDSLMQYMHVIGKTPLLTKEGEFLLSRYIQEGLDSEYGTEEFWRKVWAKDKLVMSNLRLVVDIAKKYYKTDGAIALLDLVQDGSIGLDRAAEKFDWRKGFKFSTYATWWVMQSITRNSAISSSPIRIPGNHQEKMRRMIRIENEALNSGRKLSDEELAYAVGVSVLHLAKLKQSRHTQAVLSLDQSLSGDSSIFDAESTLGYLIGEEDKGFEVIDDNFMINAMLKALEELDARAKDVVERRYGLNGHEPQSLDEVGAVYGITRERVRQIEKSALIKLKEIDSTFNLG